jgi:hypothetical protein
MAKRKNLLRKSLAREAQRTAERLPVTGSGKKIVKAIKR